MNWSGVIALAFLAFPIVLVWALDLAAKRLGGMALARRAARPALTRPFRHNASRLKG